MALLSFSWQLLGSAASPWDHSDPLYQVTVASIRKKTNKPCSPVKQSLDRSKKTLIINLLQKKFPGGAIKFQEISSIFRRYLNSHFSRFPVFPEVVDTLSYLLHATTHTVQFYACTMTWPSCMCIPLTWPSIAVCVFHWTIRRRINKSKWTLCRSLERSAYPSYS